LRVCDRPARGAEAVRERVIRRMWTPTLGSPDNPLPDARLRAKVIELLTLTLPTAKASDLVDRLRNLDGMSDVRRLPLLLSAENPPLAFS